MHGADLVRGTPANLNLRSASLGVRREKGTIVPYFDPAATVRRVVFLGIEASSL